MLTACTWQGVRYLLWMGMTSSGTARGALLDSCWRCSLVSENSSRAELHAVLGASFLLSGESPVPQKVGNMNRFLCWACWSTSCIILPFVASNSVSSFCTFATRSLQLLQVMAVALSGSFSEVLQISLGVHRSGVSKSPWHTLLLHFGGTSATVQTQHVVE